MRTMNRPDMIAWMRLLEFTDSAFPVGTFSFSNGLETAAERGVVHDAATLEAYTAEIALQAACTDGVAALHAHRACAIHHYDAIVNADKQLILCKMNAETRQMTCRMGKKLAELACRIFDDPTTARWLAQIECGATPGCYPVGQGIVFAACGIDERGLFCSHQYGVMNLVLSAALRCVRVSHYDTQQILYRQSGQIAALYERVREMDFEDMYTFAPQIDILASLHEKGTKRLFMN